MMASLHQSSMDLAAHAQAMSMMDMPPQQPNPYYRTSSSLNPYGGTDSGIRVPSEKEKIEKLHKKRSALVGTIEKLMKAMSVGDYTTKVPEDIREANEDKLNGSQLEATRLAEAIETLKKI